MALLIDVTPAGEGWAVRSDLLAEDLTFDRGGRAEAAARDLAGRLAREGRSAAVRVFLKDGALAGRIVHPANGRPELLAG